MRKIVEQINALEPTISALSDADLSAKLQNSKQRYNNGESLDKLPLRRLQFVVRQQNV